MLAFGGIPGAPETTPEEFAALVDVGHRAGIKVGAVVPSRFGELIAVRGEPLADVSVLQHVAVVIKGGLVFRNNFQPPD